MNPLILAVDDSRTIRDLIRLALGPAGYTVHTAVDGIQGLAVLATIKPEAIITDINMPRLDGLGFIQAVRKDETYRDTPIIVLTTEVCPDLMNRAQKAGATGWIVKPFDPVKLVKALQMIVG